LFFTTFEVHPQLNFDQMMARKCLLVSFLILTIVVNAFGQAFTAQPAGFLDVARSSLAWGDYDNDGDLDLLIAGDPVAGPYAMKIYRNDGGSFTDINVNFTGIYNSAVAWGDFDNDGDLDILATGRSAANSNTWLYCNKSGEFVSVNAAFPQIGSDGAIAWGDYDGDGDLDALVAGNFSCKLFNNDGGTFTDVGGSLPPVSNCWVDWGDFDNDGDLDMFIMGDMGGILTSSIYRNDKDFFTEVQCGFTPLVGGSASWCDADNDHDLDLIVCGFDEYLEPNTLIYQNLGDLQFLCMIPGMTNASLGTVAWGDYDNDGDADVLVTGQNPACGSLSSLVYRNDGGYMFTNIYAGLAGAERGNAAWGDYDNDGDLDIAITGNSGSGSPLSILYRNNLGTNAFQVNNAPSVPDGLSSAVSGHQVLLQWNHATDNTTPDAAISYNLRIGTTTGGSEMLPSMADAASGYRLISQPGNMSNDTSWQVNLPDGNYYWSVQALDHSFTGSQFADDQQFTILNVGLESAAGTEIKVFPNPVAAKLFVKTTANAKILVLNEKGILIDTKSASGEVAEFHTTNWPSGLYLLKIDTGGKTQTLKIVKQSQP
jgi:hypothetical protein